MADYAALKTRIIAEMNRDDLSDESAALLDAHVVDAVEEYASRAFWFNTIIKTINTITDNTEVALPVTIRTVDRLAGPYGDLTGVRVEDYPDYGSLASSGSPATYSYMDGTLRLDPVPDDVYTLTVYGVRQIDAPTADDDDNVWTNEAARLIVAQVKFTLWRGVFNNDKKKANAAGEVQDALAWLQRETDRRGGARLTARLVSPNGTPMRSRLGYRWY